MTSALSIGLVLLCLNRFVCKLPSPLYDHLSCGHGPINTFSFVSILRWQEDAKFVSVSQKFLIDLLRKTVIVGGTYQNYLVIVSWPLLRLLLLGLFFLLI